MQDHSNEDYGKQSYWDQRYTQEDSYDWFGTVYPACVEAVFTAVEQVYEAQRESRAGQPSAPLTVLHLGVGNSKLCEDLHKAYASKYGEPLTTAPYRLVQVAVDYSPVVIEKMRARYATGASSSPLPDTHWVVADVRDLAEVRAAYGPCFDLVIDKATMDSFQTSSDPTARESVVQMLREASECLTEPVQGSSTPTRLRRFIQITWEVPYFRLHHTTQDEKNQYAWGDKATYAFLGESDMYRVYTYDVLPPRVTPA